MIQAYRGLGTKPNAEYSIKILYNWISKYHSWKYSDLVLHWQGDERYDQVTYSRDKKYWTFCREFYCNIFFMRSKSISAVSQDAQEARRV